MLIVYSDDSRGAVDKFAEQFPDEEIKLLVIGANNHPMDVRIEEYGKTVIATTAEESDVNEALAALDQSNFAYVVTAGSEYKTDFFKKVDEEWRPIGDSESRTLYVNYTNSEGEGFFAKVDSLEKAKSLIGSSDEWQISTPRGTNFVGIENLSFINGVLQKVSIDRVVLDADFCPALRY